MIIKKKIDRRELAKKLNAMFDYVIEIYISDNENYISLKDRKGTITQICVE